MHTIGELIHTIRCYLYRCCFINTIKKKSSITQNELLINSIRCCKSRHFLIFLSTYIYIYILDIRLFYFTFLSVYRSFSIIPNEFIVAKPFAVERLNHFLLSQSRSEFPLHNESVLHSYFLSSSSFFCVCVGKILQKLTIWLCSCLVLLITIKCPMSSTFRSTKVFFFFFFTLTLLLCIQSNVFTNSLNASHNSEVRFYCQMVGKEEKQKLNLRKVLMAFLCDFMWPHFFFFYTLHRNDEFQTN